MIDIEHTLTAAEQRIDAFKRLSADTQRLPRGVRASEIFFIYATVADHQPHQIIESGRARGQSTYLLGRCFPETPVVSVDNNPDHPDAPRALAHAGQLPNVACLFGDARRVLPAVALPGDVIVIDGPKELRAMQLAMRLLAQCSPAMIFIHDCFKGTAIRRFLHRHVPWAFYSDDPRFVARYCELDAYLGESDVQRWSDPATQPSDRSYGGTFACIPARPGFPAARHWVHQRLARVAYRVQRKLGTPPEPPPHGSDGS